MRHFALTSVNKGPLYYKWYQYIRKLDSELQSLADYINWMNPNYNILNYTPGTNSTFYSQEELVQRGIIRKVYFYDSTISTTELQSLVASDTLVENALIVFPPRLQYHEGMINNFKPYSRGIFLSFFAEIEFQSFLANDTSDDSWKDPSTIWILPDVLLINGLETGITRWVLADEEDEDVIEDSIDNNLIGDSGVNSALWRLVSSDSDGSSNPVLTPIAQLDAHSLIFNNFRIISYEETQKFGADAKLIPFKEAFFVISLARMEDNLDNELAPVKTDPKNYLYCRMAGGSPYYTLNASDFVFEPRGSVHYGSSQILVLTSQPVRIAFHTQWISSYANGYISYFRNPWRAQLTNSAGVPWVGFNTPSHHLAVIHTDSSANISSEELITEHFGEVSTTNIDKTKIPVYTININEGLTINKINTENSCFEVNIW